MIISRFPIVATSHIRYIGPPIEEGVGALGAIYAKIELLDNCYAHSFNTHLISSHFSPAESAHEIT